MSIISCINERRSIRSYKDEPIDEKTINKLLELGTKAATDLLWNLGVLLLYRTKKKK